MAVNRLGVGMLTFDPPDRSTSLFWASGSSGGTHFGPQKMRLCRFGRGIREALHCSIWCTNSCCLFYGSRG